MTDLNGFRYCIRKNEYLSVRDPSVYGTTPGVTHNVTIYKDYGVVRTWNVTGMMTLCLILKTSVS